MAPLRGMTLDGISPPIQMRGSDTFPIRRMPLAPDRGNLLSQLPSNNIGKFDSEAQGRRRLTRWLHIVAFLIIGIL
jgi:hypothetical protein